MRNDDLSLLSTYPGAGSSLAALCIRGHRLALRQGCIPPLLLNCLAVERAVL